MPIVRPYPIGEVSPQPIPNVAPNVPAAGDINLFGGNQARDLQLAGQNLGQASDSLFALYERTAREANDIRVQDLTDRFLDGRRAILQGYHNQTGADAIAGADAATGKLAALRRETFGQTANDDQRRRLGPILDAHLAASTADVTRHAVAQQDVYSRGVATKAIETSRAEAKADPSLMDHAVLRAEGAARTLHAGQPPEAIETGVRTAGGSVIAGAIGDRLARNDPMGVTLFKRYADRLDPGDRHTLGAAVETLSNSIAAAAWLRDRSAGLRTPAPTGDATLDAVNAASPSIAAPPPVTSSSGTLLGQDDGIVGIRERLDEIDNRGRALTALNRQEFAADPARLRANQAAIDADTARNRVSVKADADTVYVGLRRYLTTGGPNGGPAVTPPPPTIMSRLTAAQQDAVTAQVNANIEGRKPKTDRQTWYAIRQGLTGDDARQRQLWADTNLLQLRGQLSEEDFNKLEMLQREVRENDGGAESSRLQIITRMANHALRENGIDPTPTPDGVPEDSAAAQAATFHRVLQHELLAFEDSKGRKATVAETKDMVDELMKTAMKGGWIKAGDRRPLPVQASDIPAAGEAFRKDGAQLAYVEEPAPPGQNRIAVPTDEESFERSLEEYRKRQDAEQAVVGTGGFPGAPATEPDPGSLDYWAADLQARNIVADQAAEEAGGPGGPQIEPPPGSPDYRAAEAEARGLDENAWDKLGFFQKLGVAFERFDEESKKRGASLGADSKARHLETFLDLQQVKDPNVTQKRFLLKNRNIASDLAGAVGRIVEAQRRLDELPMSEPLRRLFETSSVAEAGRLLREHPGEIAKAIGIESVPALTVSLIAMAALGPVGGAITLTGASGLDGYAKGLVGALARAGVDVSDADALTRALQDKTLMERVRKDAMTDAAIEAGTTAAAMMVGMRRTGGTARTTTRPSHTSPRATEGAKMAAERELAAPEEILAAPGSLGAARVWTTKSRLKAHGLPTSGRIRFVPKKNYDPKVPLSRGPNNGFLDRFGNEWRKGTSRTPGQPFEWDVQLSSIGRSKLGWASRDESHINVSLDGHITHR